MDDTAGSGLAPTRKREGRGSPIGTRQTCGHFYHQVWIRGTGSRCAEHINHSPLFSYSQVLRAQRRKKNTKRCLKSHCFI